jgi:hypothetical protein
MKATRKQIHDLAQAIVGQSGSLGTAAGMEFLTDQELHAKALLIQDNAATLVAWTTPEAPK